MKNIGFYNGRWDALEKLCVPALDRAFYFGDGIYDAAYTRNKIIFAEKEHVDRFFCGLKKMGIRLPYTQEEVASLLRLGVEMCDEDDLFVYFQASSGTSVRYHADREGTGNLLIMVYPKKIAPQEKTLRVCTVPDTRYGLCDIKTLNLMPNVLANKKAEKAGCYEAVFHRGQTVTEGSHSSVMLINGGSVVIPPLTKYILPSITRKYVGLLCEKNAIKCEIRTFSLDELYSADEIIVGSASSMIRRASHINGIPCGGKAAELYTKLANIYYDCYVNG